MNSRSRSSAPRILVVLLLQLPERSAGRLEIRLEAFALGERQLVPPLVGYRARYG